MDHDGQGVAVDAGQGEPDPSAVSGDAGRGDVAGAAAAQGAASGGGGDSRGTAALGGSATDQNALQRTPLGVHGSDSAMDDSRQGDHTVLQAKSRTTSNNFRKKLRAHAARVDFHLKGSSSVTPAQLAEYGLTQGFTATPATSGRHAGNLMPPYTAIARHAMEVEVARTSAEGVRPRTGEPSPRAVLASRVETQAHQMSEAYNAIRAYVAWSHCNLNSAGGVKLSQALAALSSGGGPGGGGVGPVGRTLAAAPSAGATASEGVTPLPAKGVVVVVAGAAAEAGQLPGFSGMHAAAAGGKDSCRGARLAQLTPAPSTVGSDGRTALSPADSRLNAAPAAAASTDRLPIQGVNSSTAAAAAAAPSSAATAATLGSAPGPRSGWHPGSVQRASDPSGPFPMDAVELRGAHDGRACQMLPGPFDTLP